MSPPAKPRQARQHHRRLACSILLTEPDRRWPSGDAHAVPIRTERSRFDFFRAAQPHRRPHELHLGGPIANRRATDSTRSTLALCSCKRQQQQMRGTWATGAGPRSKKLLEAAAHDLHLVPSLLPTDATAGCARSSRSPHEARRLDLAPSLIASALSNPSGRDGDEKVGRRARGRARHPWRSGSESARARARRRSLQPVHEQARLGEVGRMVGEPSIRRDPMRTASPPPFASCLGAPKFAVSPGPRPSCAHLRRGARGSARLPLSAGSRRVLLHRRTLTARRRHRALQRLESPATKVWLIAGLLIDEYAIFQWLFRGETQTPDRAAGSWKIRTTAAEVSAHRCVDRGVVRVGDSPRGGPRPP